MLSRLGMDDGKDAFEKQDLPLNLLFKLSESELKNTLREMNLTLNKRMKIYQEIRDMQSRK